MMIYNQELTNPKKYFCTIYVNDMNKQENIQLQRKRKHDSINKKNSMTNNTVDNDRIQHNSYSILKKYITKDTRSPTNDDIQPRANQSKKY